MKKIPIGVGNCSLTYLYIIGAALIKLLQDYLISLKDIKDNLKYNIFHIETVLRSHKLIRVLYGFISFIIFGILFYYISEKLKNNKKSENQKTSLQQQFLVNNTIKISQKVKLELIIISGLYTLIKILRKIASFYYIGDLDFWIFNIVFISLFMYYYFRVQIYKHHKFSLIFIFFTNLCLLFIAANIKKDNQHETVFKQHGWKCLFIIIMYIIFSLVSSFSKVASKKLMDINYLSPYRFIFFIGVFGVFFSLITLIFTSTISCGSKSNYCKIIKNDKNTTSTYLDSIPLYFSDLKGVFDKEDYKAFFIEIFIVIPLYLLTNFGEFAFEILIILYLNPNYVLISDCIYFGTTKLLEYIFNGKDKYSSKKFWVEYIAEILTLLGYTIFLEIIELRFCGLDKDIKKNITERSIVESAINDIDFDINKVNENRKDDKDSDDEDSIDENKNSIEMGMMTSFS